jgi:filamentous hemagglutinin
LGVASLAGNLAVGNLGGAVLDAAGLAYDAFATAVPGLPGGAGSLLRTARAADSVHDAAALLQRSKQVGAAWEEVAVARAAAEQTNVVRQVTIRTGSGVRTRIDIIGTDAAGSIRLTEAKSSATARLTPNQRAAFPEIAASGGTIVGKGKPGYPGGTQIPPTRVAICRPTCEPEP